MDLIVRVKEIRGRCPVYDEGDTFRLLDGYRLQTSKPVCMHSLASLMPHYNALRISDPADWGISGLNDPGKAYIQCLDPVAHTGGGTAVFEITREVGE